MENTCNKCAFWRESMDEYKGAGVCTRMKQAREVEERVDVDDEDEDYFHILKLEENEAVTQDGDAWSSRFFTMPKFGCVLFVKG